MVLTYIAMYILFSLTYVSKPEDGQVKLPKHVVDMDIFVIEYSCVMTDTFYT